MRIVFRYFTTCTFLYCHRFPLGDPELLKVWIEKMACEGWTPSKFSKLCSLHFADDCFYQLGSRRYLRKGSVPTEFDLPASTSERSPQKRQQSQSNRGTLQRQQCKQRHRYIAADHFIYFPEKDIFITMGGCFTHTIMLTFYLGILPVEHGDTE